METYWLIGIAAAVLIIIFILYFPKSSKKEEVVFERTDDMNFFYGKAGDKSIIDYGERENRKKCEELCYADKYCGGYTYVEKPGAYQKSCWGYNLLPLALMPEEDMMSGFKKNPLVDERVIIN